MRRFSLCALTIVVGFATGAQAAPVSAVVNGSFEIAAPGKDLACTAFGDTTVNVLPPDQNPGSPVWPWAVSLKPCEQGTFKAAHWSSPNVTQFGDFDGDGDREARIDGSVTADPFLGKDHNMWQAYSSPHQAYAADFTALTFRVEQGVIPRSAGVVLSLSESPIRKQHPWLGVFVECSLAFRTLTPDETGVVSVDPTTATFTSAWDGCDDTAAAWALADPTGRRAILAGLRIVQHSYWGFQTGGLLVIDDVDLLGARLLGAV